MGIYVRSQVATVADSPKARCPTTMLWCGIHEHGLLLRIVLIGGTLRMGKGEGCARCRGRIFDGYLSGKMGLILM